MLKEVWLHPHAYGATLLERLVRAGWTQVMVDLEHFDLSDAEIAAAISTLKAAGGAPVTRPAESTLPAIARCLKGGATRFLLPEIESAEQLATLWDGLDDRAGIELIPLIESRGGLANAAAIAALPFVKSVHFGPYDLSLDLGIADWRQLDSILPHVLPGFAAARAAGKTAGFYLLAAWFADFPFAEIDLASCSLADISAPGRMGLPLA